jgi:hypothetical protein
MREAEVRSKVEVIESNKKRGGRVMEVSLRRVALLVLGINIFNISGVSADIREHDISGYKADSNKRLDIEISDAGVNRIEVKKDRIAKVVGSSDEYNVQGDNKTGVIFIVSKGVSGQILPITIITEKGYTQDINLIVKKIAAPKSIVITKPIAKEREDMAQNSKEGQLRDIKSMIVEGIKQVSRGDDRNYTKRVISAKEIEEYIRRGKISGSSSFGSGDKSSKGSKSSKGKQKRNKRSDMGEEGHLGGYRERTIYYGSQGLEELGIKITEVTEYTNRDMKIYKYEWESKPSEVTLLRINEIFKGAISTSERGNTIMVVYKSSI